MRTLSCFVAIAFATAACNWPVNGAQQNGEIKEAGHVVEIKCSAFLKKPNNTAPTEIQAPRDEGMTLYARDKVKCEGDGYLKLEIYGRPYTVTALKGWYPIAENNNGDDKPQAPGRVGALRGTYRLDSSRTTSTNPQATFQMPNAWLVGLNTPAQIAIDLDGEKVTIGSPVFPPLSFDADGREHSVVTSDGNNITSLAMIEGAQLIVKSTTDENHILEVVFSPQPNGELKIVRRLYKDKNQQPTVMEAFYDRVSDIARFEFPIDSLAAVAYSPAANYQDQLFEGGETIVAELNDQLSFKSAKVGDEFTLTVRQPVGYEGATVKGHVSYVRRSSKQVEIALSFDAIQLADGKSYRFSGTIEQVHREGVMTDYQRSTVGAFMGAIVQGGKGAAVGAAIGGGSRRSIYSGNPDLELKKGTRITITPAQDRDGDNALTRIAGRVLDNNGRPVSRVKISLKGKVVSESGSDGTFSVTLVRAESRVALTFAAEGYVSNTKVYNSKAGDGNTVIIWPIAYRVKFDPSHEFDVDLGGSRIQIPANALTAPDSDNLKNLAELRFTLFDVTDSTQRAAAPGDFSGQLLDHSIRRLNSYGIFDLGVYDLKGRPLGLRNGTKVDLSIAVPLKLADKTPKQVGFFDFDLSTGRWIQIGNSDFTPTTGTYHISVIRFPGPDGSTAHNLDDPQDTTCVTIKVIDSYDGSALPYFNVTAQGLTYSASAVTDANGFACLLVDRNATFSVTAQGSIGGSAMATPQPLHFMSPNISSGIQDCGNPCTTCPFVGTVPVDHTIGTGAFQRR